MNLDSQKNPPPAPPPVGPAIKKSGSTEIFGAILIIVGILVFLSLTSFQSQISKGQEPIADYNLIGNLGHYSAEILFLMFGKSVFLLGPYFILLGILTILRSGFSDPLARLTAILIMVTGSSILGAMFSAKGAEPSQVAGGLVGARMASILQSLFGIYGTHVLSVGIVMGGIVLAIRMPVSLFLQRARSFLAYFIQRYSEMFAGQQWEAASYGGTGLDTMPEQKEKLVEKQSDTQKRPWIERKETVEKDETKQKEDQVTLNQADKLPQIDPTSNVTASATTNEAKTQVSPRTRKLQDILGEVNHRLSQTETAVNKKEQGQDTQPERHTSVFSHHNAQMRESREYGYFEGYFNSGATSFHFHHSLPKTIPFASGKDPNRDAGIGGHYNHSHRWNFTSSYEPDVSTMQHRDLRDLEKQETDSSARSEKKITGPNPFAGLVTSYPLRRHDLQSKPHRDQSYPSSFSPSSSPSDYSEPKQASKDLESTPSSALDTSEHVKEEIVSTPSSALDASEYVKEEIVSTPSSALDTSEHVKEEIVSTPSSALDASEYVKEEIVSTPSSALDTSEHVKEEIVSTPSSALDASERVKEEVVSAPSYRLDEAGNVERAVQTSSSFLSAQEDLSQDLKIEQQRSKLPELPISHVSPLEDSAYTDYRLSVDKLCKAKGISQHDGNTEIENTKAALGRVLQEYGIRGEVVRTQRGPIITLYEIKLEAGIKVVRVLGIQNEICMNLAVPIVRIIAPIPGKSTIGIEIPNRVCEPVLFSQLLPVPEGELKIVLGKNIAGDNQYAELTQLPHLLIAGATGTGKSVYLNAVISSLLYHSSPKDVRFVMIDPKMVELKMYEGIPHLLMPVITDVYEAGKALRFLIDEMEQRYSILSALRCRDIRSYNDRVKEKNLSQTNSKMPYIVVFIDELSDLMIVAAKDVEDSIIRLTQKARAVGIHIIMATQRPSVDVITALIKANCPARVAFQVAQRTDSRTILDANGAENLLGKGDMLYKSPQSTSLTRIQAPLLIQDEVEDIVCQTARFGKPMYVDIAPINSKDMQNSEDEFDEELFAQALEIIFESGKTSTSYLQRRMRIGYNKAANLIEMMEERGYLSPLIGNKPREILKRS